MAGTAWQPYEPSAAVPWDWRRAAHLHRRAGCAATWREIERDIADGPAVAISRLLAGQSRLDGLREDFPQMSEVIGQAAVGTNAPIRLQAWWFFCLLYSPDPLREKLTLLWHNHFATSNLKVRDLTMMRQQNDLLRRGALGKFGDLLRSVVKQPAMLVWLDADSNREGKPNENLARELMELFTLGIGHYSEDDVKHAARALTGWTVASSEFRFREDYHDHGEKTILDRVGNLDGDQLLDLLLSRPATAKRLAWRICNGFMAENVVTAAALAELADGLAKRNLDIRWGVETVLRSELFFSEPNIGSRINSPVEFIVGAVRALELFDRPPSTLILAEWCGRMGQELFYPPNVGGWNEGRAWLTSRSIVARSNFAAALATGHLRAPTDPPVLSELVRRHGAATKDRDAYDVFARLLLGVSLPDDDRDEILVASRQFDHEETQARHMVSLMLSRPEAQLG